MAWGARSQPWQGQLPEPSWRAWGLVVVEAQSPGVEEEEGGPFLAEGVVEEGPCPAVEEVGVEVRNRAGEEVVAVQNLVVEEGEGEAVVDKNQALVRAGEVVVEERHLLVKVVVVAEVGAYLQRLEEEEEPGGLDGRCSAASAGMCCRQSFQ